MRLNRYGTTSIGLATGGVVVTNLEGNTMLGRGWAVQADGKLLFARGCECCSAVVRYDTTGFLDPSFGNGGLALAAFGGAGASANALTIQPDGMVVPANCSVHGFDNALAVARSTADGFLDAGFSGNGMAEAPLASGAARTSLAIRPDGKIVVVASGGSHMIAARVTGAGDLDRGFFSGGMQVVVFPGLASSFGNAVRAQAEGKTLAVGAAERIHRPLVGTLERQRLA